MIKMITVSSKGQIVIPENVRKNMGIKTGSKLVLIEREGTLVLKREEDITKQLIEMEKKECTGWLTLGEKSFHKLWDNPKDEEHWKKYLKEK